MDYDSKNARYSARLCIRPPNKTREIRGRQHTVRLLPYVGANRPIASAHSLGSTSRFGSNHRLSRHALNTPPGLVRSARKRW